jgi:hypothetical protein
MNIKLETKIAELNFASPETVLSEAFYVLDSDRVWKDIGAKLTVGELIPMTSLTQERVIKRLERIARLNNGVCVDHSTMGEWVATKKDFAALSVDGTWPPITMNATQRIEKFDSNLDQFISTWLKSHRTVVCVAETIGPAFSAAMYLRGLGLKTAFAAKPH